jgi:phenylacetate-CoA ligase
LTNEDADSLIEGIKKVNPDIIVCYPTRMVVVAQSVRRDNIKGILPRILITTAETLDINMREYINETFNVDLIDYYGSWETGMIAWECYKHEGYHAIVDSVVLEVVKNNRNVEPGESGEVIVTNLVSYTMPFIRYNLGDIGVYVEKMCSCGRSFPLLLEKVEGRSDEFIVLPSGEFLSPNAFDVPIKYVDGIEKFQVIQEDRNNISVLLVISQRDSSEIVKAVERKLREHVPDSVNLNIKLVNKIPMATSGKQKCVISKVKVQLN